MCAKLEASIVGLLVGTLPLAAVAQGPAGFSTFSAGPASQTGPTNVGATPTIDLVRVGSMPSVPLRNPGVVYDSEAVYLNGLMLVRGVDYTIDYPAGVVYVIRPSRPGDQLRVSYRYVKGYQPAAGQGLGIAGFKFDIAPGALSMRVGFGLTERQADGNVLSSNIYGWSNSFALGGGKLAGLFLIGQREQVNTRSGFEFQNKAGQPDLGTSQFMLQRFASGFAGGTVEASYQDISKNFTSFGAVRDAGYDDSSVNQLAKERGMTRMGFALNNIDLGGLKLSQAFKEVTDGSGSIQWQSYGLQRGGLALNWEQQKVGQTFKRFNDMAEGNKGQLAKEAGLTRENLTGSYAAKFGKLSFGQSSIEDARGQGIWRRNITLDTSRLKLALGEQDVSSEFTRFGSLAEPEQVQWSRERGMSRQWLTMDYGLFGAKIAPLHFAQSSVSNSTGEFRSTGVSATVGKWNLDYAAMGANKGFGGLSALSPTELDANVRTVAEMYQPGGMPVKPEERNWFIRGAGLEREFARVSGSPFKGWKLTFDNLALRGVDDDGSLQTLKLEGKNLTANFRSEHLGQKFSELGNLMEFERQRLGTIAGFDRTDFGFDANLGHGRALQFASTDANSLTGALKRATFAYDDKNFQLSGASRNVATGFPVTTGLSDPERDLLNSMRGFDEQDFHLKWALLPNLKIDTSWMDAHNADLKQSRFLQNTVLSWVPDKLTEVGYIGMATRTDDPFQVLFANAVDRLTISRNLGKYGIVHYLHEDIDYNGQLTNLPGSHREYFAYETKLSPTTAVKTEQTKTSFDNGQKEDISANTISTELTKKIGVSVSDIQIDRTGDKSDEAKRNYGVWYDFGNGIRFSYGYARQLIGPSGAQQETWGLAASPGTGPMHLGELGITSATAALNKWDDVRTQGSNNLQLCLLKPIRLGFLQDVRLAFSYDAMHDKSNWLRDNQLVNFSGRIGSNTVGFDYRSQIAPNGLSGVDRTFVVATDQGDKRPLKGSMAYKVRSLPMGKEVMIRNISVTARPTKGLELTNQVLTNPEVVQGNAILGSIVQASRANRWRLDFTQNPNVTIGASWDELLNDQTRASARAAGINVSFSNKSGSPIQLYYGLEDNNNNGLHSKAHRYHIQFTQRPGPNQALSLFLGNVSYEGTLINGAARENWSARIDYQLRF